MTIIIIDMYNSFPKTYLSVKGEKIIETGLKKGVLFG